MKNKLICLIIIFFVVIQFIKAEENHNKTKEWTDYIGITASLGVLSSTIIHIKIINYLQKYYYLIWGKNSSEQLKLLLQARKSISIYTSPVEVKVLNDLIWLHNFITVRCSEMIKGKTPVEQVIVLEEYLRTVSDLSSKSILAQHSWFVQYYYNISFPYYMFRQYLDKWFDTAFIDGFIREIIKKYNLKT